MSPRGEPSYLRSSTSRINPGEREFATQTQEPLSAASVSRLVSAWAGIQPDALAVASAGDGVLSYGELDCRANQLAHHLHSVGLRPGTLVGLCMERSPELVVGALGILKAGGGYVPLDPDFPTDRLAFMLNDAQAPILVTKQSLGHRLGARGEWKTVALDADAQQIARYSSASPDSDAKRDDLAYMIYTSGSTGEPKGVEITHWNLLNLISWHQHTFAVTPTDRATLLASPAFDAAVWELWPYLAAGASVHVGNDVVRVSPELLRDWLVAERITVAFVVTALAERLMALDWPAGASLRFMLTGGDALHHYPSRALPFLLVNNYGPTECTVVTTSGAVPLQAHPDQPPSIGRPISNTQVYILDDRLRPVPVGEPGELCVGGAGVARGYHHRPELTAEKFVPDSFSHLPGARLYRTGDRARYLPDGQVAFLGRIDEQIKIRGYRIEPNDIVSVLRQHPAIHAGVVVARGDGADKQLVAYVVPAAKAQLKASTLQRFVRERLPEYMVPTVWVELESLPLTSSGKVDRPSLPVPSPSNTLCDESLVLPRTPTEERLAEILAALLNVKQVGANDNFFMLGGHSLMAGHMIARVRDAFGVELTLRSLFDHPTVEGMSAEIERLILAKLEAMSEEEVQRALRDISPPGA